MTISFTKQHYGAALILLLGTVVAFGILSTPHLFAQEDVAIDFPIAELGGCTNEEDCRLYCDQEEHFEACFAFARDNGLLTEEERAKAEEFETFEVGPGGCDSHISCELYCDDISNINECLAYAEEHDVLSGEDLEEARIIQQAVNDGISFPGNCTNKRACEAYCTDPAHGDECVTFAIAVGFIPPGEAEQAKKAMRLMLEGRSPGGCQGEEECDLYCEDESHFKECVAFAEEAGFITAEDAEFARKTGGVGPGGCRGEEQCQAFCDNPDNQEVCFAFAKEHGFVEEGDHGDFPQEGKQQFTEVLSNAPEEVKVCIQDSLGNDILSSILAGQAVPTPEIGEEVRHCFEALMPQGEFESFDHDGSFDDRFKDEFFEGDHGGQPFDFPADELQDFDGDGLKDRFETHFEGEVSHEFDKQFEAEFEREFKAQFEQEFERQFESFRDEAIDEFRNTFPDGVPSDFKEHAPSFESFDAVPDDDGFSNERHNEPPPPSGGEAPVGEQPEAISGHRILAGALFSLLSGIVAPF